ncbi:MAG: hypothetical protein CMD29_01950 [Flavobacteriales bacterium]|nr:hypothetical protein [Flavobacteriales bacterium]
MKISPYNIVLLLLLFIYNVGLSGVTGYTYKEFKNYNYLDSGEYYIDSNFNFESLFPEDSIAKDVEIKFIKNKIIHSVGDSYFNVCKIKNKTNKILDLGFKLNMPAGWELLNSSVLFSRSLIPGGEINLPLRLTIPQNAVGGTAYVINMVASTKEKEFYRASYIKIPGISDWDMRTTKNLIYFNERYNTEDLEVYLSNKGNSQEIIKLNFKIGKNLKMLDSTANYITFVSVPPYTDTLISFQVQKLNRPELVGNYSGGWRENEILVAASSQNGKRKTRSVKFLDLDSEYYNLRDEMYSPLNITFSMFNLVSGQNTFTNITAFGQIQLNKEHDFNYHSVFSGLNFQNGATITSYLNNPNLYNLNFNYRWNEKLFATLGNVGLGNPLINFRGTGISSSYRLENGSNLKLSLLNSRFFPAWMVSSSYKSTISIPGVTKGISYELSLAYQDNRYSSFRAIYPQLSFGFSPIKNQNIRLNIMPSFGTYNFSGNLPGNDSSMSGIAYSVGYNGKLKKLSLSWLNRNTINSLDAFQAVIMNTGEVKYPISNKNNLLFTHNSYTVLPAKLYNNPNFLTEAQSLGQSINRLTFRSKYNKKITLIAGPSLQTTNRQSFVQRNNPTSSFTNLTYGLFGSIRLKLNRKEYISPSLFFGNTSFINSLIDSLDYISTRNISFGINYYKPKWNLNFRYVKGVTFFIDQNVFVFEDTRILNETVFLRANFNKEIPSRNLSLQGSCNWFLRMPQNIQNFGLSGRMDYQIIRRLNGFVNTNFITNSLSNQEDGTSSSRFFNINLGLTYNVDIPQPKIKYYDLKIVCFNDLNGDKIKSDDEVGIPNIILNVKRDLETSFLKTTFYERELISDIEGNIVLMDLPEGDFLLSFRPLENLGVLYNTKGSEQEISMQEDYTLFVPYGEGYKVTGQVKISRDVNSSLGTVKPSGVRVEAVSTSGEIFSTLTGVNGSFSISVPSAGYYKVSINNIFGDNFFIKNNKTLIQFDGFKLFRLDFDVVEKNREVIIKGNSKFNFGDN